MTNQSEALFQSHEQKSNYCQLAKIGNIWAIDRYKFMAPAMKAVNKEQIKSLEVLLASANVLFIKTQNYHWNVKGQHFYHLHLLFQKQYEQLFDTIDNLAEIISACGGFINASASNYSTISLIKEASDKPIPSTEMLKNLAMDHKGTIGYLESILPHFEGLERVSNFLEQMLEDHHKMMWMLESSL